MCTFEYSEAVRECEFVWDIDVVLYSCVVCWCSFDFSVSEGEVGFSVVPAQIVVVEECKENCPLGFDFPASVVSLLCHFFGYAPELVAEEGCTLKGSVEGCIIVTGDCARVIDFK